MLFVGLDIIVKIFEWVMLNFLNYFKIMEKVKIEIDINVDKGCLVDDFDLLKFNYIYYIINEILRFFLFVFFLVLYYLFKDLIIGGYYVFKGIMLLVNVWVIYRDFDLWEDLIKFELERFEKEKDGFKYMFFGLGRRVCLGYVMGKRVVGLVLGFVF